ncbi:MAG: hypothetical protein RR355_05400, partial [Oscillospiraceae bacterium]
MKKFISLALVAAMIASMGITAFAAPGDPTSTSGSYDPPVVNPYASPWAKEPEQQKKWNDDRTKAINRGTDDNTDRSELNKMTSKKVRVVKGDFSTSGYQPSENIVFMPLVYDIDGKTNTTDDQYYIIDTAP